MIHKAGNDNVEILVDYRDNTVTVIVDGKTEVILSYIKIRN